LSADDNIIINKKQDVFRNFKSKEGGLGILVRNWANFSREMEHMRHELRNHGEERGSVSVPPVISVSVASSGNGIPPGAAAAIRPRTVSAKSFVAMQVAAAANAATMGASGGADYADALLDEDR
jgi:RecA/RadA recombinase